MTCSGISVKSKFSRSKKSVASLIIFLYDFPTVFPTLVSCFTAKQNDYQTYLISSFNTYLLDVKKITASIWGTKAGSSTLCEAGFDAIEALSKQLVAVTPLVREQSSFRNMKWCSDDSPEFFNLIAFSTEQEDITCARVLVQWEW